MDDYELIDLTRDWIAGDPDERTREDLQSLLDAGAFEELTERMAGMLHFGTAGLRGRVEGGSNRMNRAVVIRTTRGIVDYLATTDHDSTGLVVVGRDARLSSERLMKDTVGVLAAAGVRVRYFPYVVPTPVVAYAALRLEARMAIVITASHNPPQDNGYKVYDANGVQIVPPVDEEIAAAIERVGHAAEVPRARDPYGEAAEIVTPVPDGIFGSYLDDIGLDRREPSPPPLVIVHTPLHGVGGRFVTAALTRYGGHRVIPVAEQFEPDGRFPTVAFPNPEEQGALDLAVAAAVEEDADLVIANDPDTDRLAVAVPDPEGEWRLLTGNQIGVLLADRMLAGTSRQDAVVINSIVSTPMLADVAHAHGAGFETTLTGFKWIWTAALDLASSGGGTFVFGFEEALGYSVSAVVRDKDGISAAVAFADLAADARARSRTVLDGLGELYAEHGVWVSAQHSVVRQGTRGAIAIAAAVDRVGASPPGSLGGDAVVDVKDYREGAEQRPRYLGAASLVELTLASGGRVLVRPSGTEPKLKIYVDLRKDLGHDEDWRMVEHDLNAVASAAAIELVETLGLRSS